MRSERVLCACIGMALASPAIGVECGAEDAESLKVNTVHFAAPPGVHPGSLGFQLVDLRGNGQLELVQGAYQFSVNELDQPSFGMLYARERVGILAYRTRSALPFLGERLLLAAAIDGSKFGVAEHAVALVTRPKDSQYTGIRIIEGESLKSAIHCSIGFAAVSASIGPDVDGGADRLYLQDASAVHVYSLPGMSELRVLDSAGGSGFAIAQLDDDPTEELVVATTPGRVIDSLTGVVEWEYTQGWHRVGTGRFGFNNHLGIVAQSAESIALFTAAPYERVWSEDQEQFAPSQVFAVSDVNGDARDEVLIAGGYTSGPQYTYSLRVYDTLTQAVLIEDIESRASDIVALAALPGREPDTMEIIEALSNDSVRTHTLGSQTPTWTEWSEFGPFPAFALGRLDEGNEDTLVFAGSNASRSKLHVVSLTDWEEIAQSPSAGHPDEIRMRVEDMVALKREESLVSSVGMGGRGFFGAVASIELADWSTNWQFGVLNEPSYALLGGRTVTKVVAYDADGDGADDVVAGADDSGTHLGAVVGAFGGTDGAELWRTPPLGGPYSAVSDLKIGHHDGHGSDVLYVAVQDALGESSVKVLNLVSGVLLLSIPQSASAVAPIDGDGLVVLTTDGYVRALDHYYQVIWERQRAEVMNAVTQPSPNGPVLLSAGARLRWLDVKTGAQLGVSRPIASSLAVGNRWAVNAVVAQGQVSIIAGSDAGMFALEVALPASDTILNDGFE